MEKERFQFKVAELEEQLNSMDRRLSASDDAFVSSQKALSAMQLALKEECRINSSAVACLKKNGEAVPEVSPLKFSCESLPVTTRSVEVNFYTEQYY